MISDLYIKQGLLNDDNTDANLNSKTQDTQLQIAISMTIRRMKIELLEQNSKTKQKR